MPNSNENVPKMGKEEIIDIGIDKIENFPNHPFKVADESLEELKESINEYGITTPLIVREKQKGKYEIISGHRRKRVCELLDIDKIPCIVRNFTDDEAIIQMVDSNIQRKEILPSERAFAYKMKLDAIKRKAGRPKKENSRQLVGNLESVEMIGKETGESGRQIQRYIRLTELIPKILEMVDIGRIAFNPAVELSYLTKEEQYALLDSIQWFEATPTLSQAQELKRLSQNRELTDEKLANILSKEKGNQDFKYEISYNQFAKYIPKTLITPKEVQNYLLKCAIACKEKGIDVEKLDIALPKDKPKNKNRDAR